MAPFRKIPSTCAAMIALSCGKERLDDTLILRDAPEELGEIMVERGMMLLHDSIVFGSNAGEVISLLWHLSAKRKSRER